MSIASPVFWLPEDAEDEEHMTLVTTQVIDTTGHEDFGDTTNVHALYAGTANVDGVLGMLLNHVALHDENGERLDYNPRKASELEAVLPWQAVPVVRRGLFLLSGSRLDDITFNAGTALTSSAATAGEWETAAGAAHETLVGYTLGNNHLTVGNADHHTEHLIMLEVGGHATSGTSAA